MKLKERYKVKLYDLVVVGGGLSGMCAAIAAARHGVKVALVHARPVFGGNASSEIRMHICGASCHISKEDVAETGILEEILLENKNRNPYQNYSIWDSILWEKLYYQKNLDIYLNTTLNDVEKENNRIVKITCYQSTTEMTFDFNSVIFLDATGNGTLGYFAEAEYSIGSEGKVEYNEPSAPEEPNNYTMGNTLMFQSVDRGFPIQFKKPFWAYSFTEDQLKHRTHYNATFALDDSGTVEFLEGKMKALPEFYTLDSGYWWIELGGVSKDIIADGENIRDELTRCIYGIWDHIKNCSDHGAENYDLVWVGMVPGTRESRRLMGDYLLNENDIRANRIFKDAVCYGGWPMDVHVPEGLFAFDKMPSRILNFDGIYTIPYRCFYSKNVENLMMAGRSISATKVAMGSTRIMGTCAVGGQACGTAAALAIKYSCSPREVSKYIDELQQTLLKDDCYIPGYRNSDPADLARTANITASSFLYRCGPENITNGISRRVNNEENCWESDGISPDGEKLSLNFSTIQHVSQVRLTFDPNLTSEIMPSISVKALSRQVKGMPEELVSEYDLDFWNGQNCILTKKIRDNYQRLQVFDFSPLECDKITFTFRKTHGYPSIRVYEIRVYS